MRFIYHKNAKESIIKLEGDSLHHIFAVRRARYNIGDVLKFANLNDSTIYSYKLIARNKKEALFEYVDSALITQDSPQTHIIQAIIDSSELGKILPTLNELFVKKLTLFYSDFSQKNYKIHQEKFEKILINSCQQCGRLDLMDIEILPHLEAVLESYPNALALDFGGESCDIQSLQSVIIGAEGGFSQKERILLQNKTFGINHALILRSTSAALWFASQKVR